MKKYRAKIEEIEIDKKRLIAELKEQKSINNFQMQKMVDINLQIQGVKDELNEMRKLREKDRKEIDHSTITIESLYKLIDEFLKRYPEVKLSEVMQSVKNDAA